MSDFSSDRKGFGLRTELEQVYRTHRQALFSLALSITGCVAGAEDSVHDAFARLLRRGGELPVDHVSYVFAAVRNSAVDVRRLHQRERKAFESLIVDTSVSQSGQSIAELIEAEERLQLHRAIEELDDESREIVIMKIYGELTFEQIAAVLESPPGTVATRYRRALLKIESQLGSHHDQSKPAII